MNTVLKLSLAMMILGMTSTGVVARDVPTEDVVKREHVHFPSFCARQPGGCKGTKTDGSMLTCTPGNCW